MKLEQNIKCLNQIKCNLRKHTDAPFISEPPVENPSEVVFTLEMPNGLIKHHVRKRDLSGCGLIWGPSECE